MLEEEEEEEEEEEAVGRRHTENGSGMLSQSVKCTVNS